MRLIDEIYTEIFEKDILGEIEVILLSRNSLEELKEDYAKEFEIELIESGRKVSDHDVKEYFGKPIIIQDLSDKKYKLLKSV